MNIRLRTALTFLFAMVSIMIVANRGFWIDIAFSVGCWLAFMYLLFEDITNKEFQKK